MQGLTPGEKDAGTAFALACRPLTPRARSHAARQPEQPRAAPEATMDGATTRRCGAIAQPNGGVHWHVWAPRAQRVDLVLTDGIRRRLCPMQQERRGFYHYQEDSIGEGSRYLFRLD